jgi:hypothetical protein
MRIRIEKGTGPHKTKAGKEYYSFWVRCSKDKLWCSSARWKIYLKDTAVGSPTEYKGLYPSGKPKYDKLTEQSKEFWLEVRRQALEYFGFEDNEALIETALIAAEAEIFTLETKSNQFPSEEELAVMSDQQVVNYIERFKGSGETHEQDLYRFFVKELQTRYEERKR